MLEALLVGHGNRRGQGGDGKFLLERCGRDGWPLREERQLAIRKADSPRRQVYAGEADAPGAQVSNHERFPRRQGHTEPLDEGLGGALRAAVLLLDEKQGNANVPVIGDLEGVGRDREARHHLSEVVLEVTPHPGPEEPLDRQVLGRSTRADDLPGSNRARQAREQVKKPLRLSSLSSILGQEDHPHPPEEATWQAQEEVPEERHLGAMGEGERPCNRPRRIERQHQDPVLKGGLGEEFLEPKRNPFGSKTSGASLLGEGADPLRPRINDPNQRARRSLPLPFDKRVEQVLGTAVGTG